MTFTTHLVFLIVSLWFYYTSAQPILRPQLFATAAPPTLEPEVEGSGIPSQLWEQYKQEKRDKKRTFLPDFSYVGYRRSEVGLPSDADLKLQIFDVTKFGATPNDNKDDQDGIEAAVQAAVKNRGGIVKFPPGKFHIHTRMTDNRAIGIAASNIVLRGSGTGHDGTQIFHVFPTNDYGVPAIKFRGSGVRSTSTSLVKDVVHNDFGIQVKSASDFWADDYVIIEFDTTLRDAFQYFLDGHTLDPSWTETSKDLISREYHQIRNITGNRVEFYDPILTNLKVTWNVTMTKVKFIENVGIENLTMMGNWLGNSVHLRSKMEDAGWNSVRMDYVANGWIRQVNFINVVRSILIQNSMLTTVVHCRFLGTEGHFGYLTQRGTDNLIGLTVDHSLGLRHAFSVSHYADGTVFWRDEMKENLQIDCHGNEPHSTLFDTLEGGTLTGSGGSNNVLPNHLRDIIFWNFELRDSNGSAQHPLSLNFWQHRPVLAAPIFVGLHGTIADVDMDTVKVNENQNHIVSPESLFEAQLALRLKGKLPSWITTAKAAWKDIKRGSVPSFFDVTRKNDPHEFNNFVSEFNADQIVEYLSGISLKQNETNRWNIQAIGKSSTIVRNDFVKLTQILHNLVSYVYLFNGKKGEDLLIDTHFGGVTATLRSMVKEPNNFYSNPRNQRSQIQPGDNPTRNWDSAQELANAIGAKIRKDIGTSLGATVITVIAPNIESH